MEIEIIREESAEERQERNEKGTHDCAHLDRCVHCHGVDLDDLGEIYFSDVIDDGTGEMLRQELRKKAWDIKKNVRPGLSGELTIFLESPGGSVSAAMAIASTMRDIIVNMGIPITVVVNGLAASAAIDILQSASKRIMSPLAQILIHSIRGAVWEHSKPDDIESSVKSWRKFSRKSAELIASRNTAGYNDPEWWDKKSQQEEWYLDADDALKFGLIDEIR